MQLQLTSTGVLPVQVHDTTLDDIEILFGRAQRSTRRVILLGNLQEYVTGLQTAGIRDPMLAPEGAGGLENQQRQNHPGSYGVESG